MQIHAPKPSGAACDQQSATSTLITPRRPRVYQVLLALAVLGVGLTTGCLDSPNSPALVAEGILHSVSYARGDGTIGGITRVNHAGAVPGGNGSFNINAYGRLSTEFLIIDYPDSMQIKSHIIPVHCLHHVNFLKPKYKPEG